MISLDDIVFHLRIESLHYSGGLSLLQGKPCLEMLVIKLCR